MICNIFGTFSKHHGKTNPRSVKTVELFEQMPQVRVCYLVLMGFFHRGTWSKTKKWVWWVLGVGNAIFIRASMQSRCRNLSNSCEKYGCKNKLIVFCC